MIIFVFGSNLLGIHGAGAAKHAAMFYDAVQGEGNGPTGSAYAIPTKRLPTRKKRQLPLQVINSYVADFLLYAGGFDLTTNYFKVTRIGCGLAGYTDEEIGPMFKNHPPNCYFDPIWAKKFGYPKWPDWFK